VCIVDLVKAFGAYNVSARLVDVETAEIYLTAGETEVNGNLIYEMRWAADKIFKQMHSKSQSAGSATPQRSATQPHYSQQQQSNPQQPIQQQDNSAASATAFISTQPSHADIYIGGKLIGRANEGQLQVPVGTHDVKIVGYLEKTKSMTFKLGQNDSLFVPLLIEYQHFTTGERTGAMFVNMLIPGLGSGVMMKDGKGAGITWGLIGGGLVGGGGIMVLGAYSGNIGIAVLGSIIASAGMVSGSVFNIVRPWAYQIPRHKVAADDATYGDVKFAVIPGDFKAVVAYELSF
jgi:hypothetical protein